jgi:hypothetical protein
MARSPLCYAPFLPEADQSKRDVDRLPSRTTICGAPGSSDVDHGKDALH